MKEIYIMSLDSKMKRKSVVILLWGIVVGIGGYFVLTVGALNGLFDLYENISDRFFQKKAEDNINVIYTGSSIKYIESIFGVPVKEEHSENGEISEYTYSFKKFYLQVVYNKNNRVIFYSVTSKDKNFHPKVPYLGGVLGDSFESFGNNIDYLQSGYSSKFYQYEEGHFLGYPGNYRNFYLSYNPAGIEYMELKPLTDWYNNNNSYPDAEELIEFRKNNAPNTFGVGDINGSHDGPELFYGIGIEYYDARDIPDKD